MFSNTKQNVTIHTHTMQIDKRTYILERKSGFNHILIDCKEIFTKYHISTGWNVQIGRYFRRTTFDENKRYPVFFLGKFHQYLSSFPLDSVTKFLK